VGDGLAEDTEAVQRAVDAAEGLVYFPKGSYRLTRPVIVDLASRGNTSLVGDGVARVIMAGPGPAFHFVGTHDGTADPGDFRDSVWDRERLPLVTGLEIRGAHPESIGVRLEKTMQATLTNLLIRRCKAGVHLEKRNRNLIIAHCHIYHNLEVGILFDRVDLHQAIIADSHISYNSVAGILLVGGNMRNFQIVANDIEYNHDEQREGSADILIDMRSEDASFREGTIVGNTIQANVSPGGANVRVLGGANLRSGGLLAITGNMIGSQTDNIHVVDCRGVTISSNSLYSAAGRTILLERSANIVIGNNTIDWNPDHKGKRFVDGITINECRGVSLSSNIIENSFQGSPEAGGTIEVNRSEDVTIANCQVLDPRYRGIVLTDAVRCRVTGCTVIDRRQPPTARASIQVAGKSRDNLIIGNIVNQKSLQIPPDSAEAKENFEVTTEV
jgi:parallel beta-helix repeat protein